MAQLPPTPVPLGWGHPRVAFAEPHLPARDFVLQRRSVDWASQRLILAPFEIPRGGRPFPRILPMRGISLGPVPRRGAIWCTGSVVGPRARTPVLGGCEGGKRVTADTVRLQGRRVECPYASREAGATTEHGCADWKLIRVGWRSVESKSVGLRLLGPGRGRGPGVVPKGQGRGINTNVDMAQRVARHGTACF